MGYNADNDREKWNSLHNELKEYKTKEFIIYEKGETRVYIHKFKKRKGFKLDWYGIRRDDNRGLACLLGIIKFDGGWRQYVTEFEPDTKWSSGCKKKICEFEDMLNKKWRDNLKKR
jgi:hypothetical protein